MGMQTRSGDHPSPILTANCERYHLNAIDNAVWSAGEWWSSLQSRNGPRFGSGCWSAIYVREGNAWKIRLLTLSERPQPAAIADTK